MTPPLGDIAHLGHVELLTPDLDGSLRFFTEYLGLTVNGHSGDSVCLRTWDDYEHHSLVLTAHETSGIRRTALRASSEEALQRRVKELEAAGHEGRWTEGEPGLGPLYVTTDPGGHEIALYWESEWYEAPDALKPGLKNQPQAKPGHGVGVRRLDHINYLAADVAANADFHQHLLGARPTEQVRLDTGKISAKWLTFTNKSYDVVYTEDWTGSRGRLHHIAFATDTREDIRAMSSSVEVFGLGRTLAGIGLGGLLPTAISMVSDYAPRGRAALTIGMLMTAHHAGGILSAYVAKWLVEPVGWRAAFWVCVVPLLFAPVLAKFLPESLSFLVAKGRTEEARELAERYEVELPAQAGKKAPADRWNALTNLFRGGEWIQTLLYWLASFGGLLLVYGVATRLPTLMRSEGYNLGSALTFVVIFNLGGIVGMLVAGRASDRFGAPRISAIWFALTAAGVFLLSVHMPLAVTFVVVFFTGVFLNSAQTMIYATVSIRSIPENRATAVGWTSGMGRFGAVFGPWLGGQLLAADHGDWGFTAFALAGLSSLVFIGIAALRSSKQAPRSAVEQELISAH